MKTHKTAKGTSCPTTDTYQRVTDRIIELLESGTAPWQRPWNAETGPPKNFISGKPYQGINTLLLGWEARPSPWWMTYRQAVERGGSVRKGERGTRIVKYGRAKPKDDDSEPADAGKAARTAMFLKEFTVFHACQIEGIEFPQAIGMMPLSEEQRISHAEAVARNMPSPPLIREGAGSQACYIPALDQVRMPAFACFRSPEAFYATLYHELIHSTGHSSRLARASLLGFRDFADHAYSKEELVAEMGAALLSTEIGIVGDGYEASAAYLQSWLRVLKVKEHKRWIVEAAGRATKAVNHILRRIDGEPVVTS